MHKLRVKKEGKVRAQYSVTKVGNKTGKGTQYIKLSLTYGSVLGGIVTKMYDHSLEERCCNLYRNGLIRKCSKTQTLYIYSFNFVYSFQGP